MPAYVTVTDRIPAVVAAVLKNSKEAKEESAREAADRVRALAPVDKGVLRDSVVSDGDEVRAEADYAPAVNYGTARTAANPFFSDGVMQVRQRFLERCARGFLKI